MVRRGHRLACGRDQRTVCRPGGWNGAGLEAPPNFHPPAGLTRAEALARARASRDRMLQAIRAIPESRGLWTVKSMLGLITVYQVGEWATAHVARHNAQAKRVIG